MDHEWIVEVKDDKGAALTNATVALVETSALAGQDWPYTAAKATHAHDAGGTYKAAPPIVPVAGEWMLIVRVAGKSPVVQPLKMVVTKTDVITTPSPRTAATVTFSSEVKTVATSKTRRARLGVKMFPSSELVFLSGTEYFNAGTRFRIFAENYREGLRREKLVDAGVIATLLSTDDRSRETHVPAMAGGWLKVGHKSFGPTSGIKPGTEHAPVVGQDVSIVDLYKYLSQVGASEPGRVKEVGIFSHSWPGGPLLFNTSDNSLTSARDIDDFDGRRKDFNATNVAGWPKMKAAMAPGGTWHVWGCSATTHHKNLTVAAHKHKKDGDTAFFTVTTSVQHHGGATASTMEERTNRARIRFDMDQRFRSLSYMAAAVSHLAIPVFGAPPGVGSSFDQKRSIMFIDTASYANLFAYFKDVFGPEFTPTSSTYDRGYVDYQKVGGRPAPPAPGFSSEAYIFNKDFDNKKTTLSVDSKKTVTMAGTAITLKVIPKTGFATPGKSGHQFELHDTADKTRSRAIYVQDDKQTFNVKLDGAGKFTVLGATL
ncbi:MAG TPA: hypothetical protein VGB85_30930 [Nannocystis sp.]